MTPTIYREYREIITSVGRHTGAAHETPVEPQWYTA